MLSSFMSPQFRAGLRSKLFTFVVLLAGVFLLTAPRPLSAQDRGSIAGTVTDTNKSVLQGARVEIMPETQTATTGQQGSFIISGVKPGHYTLTVSYIGFQPFSTGVDVAAGAIANLTAALAIGNASENVTVRPEREVGEVEALNRERVSDHIVQVLPSEVINSLPNTNIADAVGRLPSVSLERDEGEGKYIQIRGTEPRLSNVTIDGIVVPSPENVRNVKLDAIPANLVDSVELSKTLSANQDGDAIGGSVNLVTREATDQPYFAVQGLLGHTPIAGGRASNQEFGTYGRRFFNNKLGFLISGSYDYNARGINDLEPVAAVNPITDGGGTPVSPAQYVNAPNATDLRDYHYDRSRYGFGGTLDYKLNDLSQVYLRGLFSHFNDNGENWNRTLGTGATATDSKGNPIGGFTSPTVTTPNGSTSLTDNFRQPGQQVWSLQAGAHQEFGNNVWNYRAALSQARYTGGFSDAAFGGPSAVQFGVTQANPHTPQFPVLNGVNINDPALYTLSGFRFQNNHIFERDIVGELSYARRYTRGSKFGAFEAGFKVRDVIKGELYHNVTATLNDGATAQPMSNFLSPYRDTGYYFGRYAYGPVPQYNKVLAYYNTHPGEFTTSQDVFGDLQNDWHVQERVYAGYGMNTITIQRWKLQTGLRFETTQDNVIGNSLVTSTPTDAVPKPDPTVNHTTVNNTYTYVLPSIQVQYNLNNNADIRFAYGIGIARPNYGDLAPYQQYDPSQSKFVTAGNPNLKPTWANNFDLLGEKYLKQIGVVQLGAFYKQFYNPIYAGLQSVVPPGRPLAGLQQIAPANGPSAHLFGIEAAYQQQLTFLPGALNGTGVSINYSYTTSQADVPGRSDKPALIRDAPQNWNVDATYDKYRISARMGLTHNDAYISQYNYKDGATGGIKSPAGDVYIYPHTQVDAEASYLVPRARGLSVVAQFLNLNNDVFGFFQGSEKYPIQREYYSPTYTFGLRWTLTPETGAIFRQ